MSQPLAKPVLRRRSIPRLSVRLPCKAFLPAFLMEHRALPMTPAPIMGPPDPLEQAILDSHLWQEDHDPVEFDAFDAEEEVISVIVEEGAAVLNFDLVEGDDGVQILANGLPMARVAATGRAFSQDNIRVLHTGRRV